MSGLEDFVNFFKGFAVTGKIPFKPKVTVQYPEEKRPKGERFHGRHVLNRYEDGMEKCIGCELCAGVCPARCIYVRGADNPPDAPVSPGERYGFVYEINFLRCIHCDLCVEACPTEAITESKMFEFSFTNRDDAIYTKAELLVGDDGQPRHLPWEDWKPGDDRNTSAWVRATSPGGSAAMEGMPLWSGELGYGVRPAQPGQSDPQSADVAADTDVALREISSAAFRGDRRQRGSAGARRRRRHGVGPAGLMLASLYALAVSASNAGYPDAGAARLAHGSAWAVFVVGAGLILVGAAGVILLRNPVHCALLLVVTLFGIAVEFIDQSADFLAAIQIIVYAGAIVILFLFVIMFLGVDRREAIAEEPFRGQKPIALALGVVTLVLLVVLSRVSDWTTGARSVTGRARSGSENVQALGQAIYTRYLLPFEMTSALLVIAVVAAVVLARTKQRSAGEMSRAEQEEVPR